MIDGGNMIGRPSSEPVPQRLPPPPEAPPGQGGDQMQMILQLILMLLQSNPATVTGMQPQPPAMPSPSPVSTGMAALLGGAGGP